MALTHKQEKFVQAIIDGHNQSDAYRLAYSAEHWTPEAVTVEACRVMQSPNVSLVVQQKKQALAQMVDSAAAWNLDRIVNESAVNVQLGRDLRQIAASNGAITTIGKAVGVLVDRSESTTESRVVHELDPGKLLEALAALEAIKARLLLPGNAVVDAEGHVQPSLEGE
jgi:hypothetical protein